MVDVHKIPWNISHMTTSVSLVFTGSSNTELHKEKQRQYKKELEEQIQEKELLKAKYSKISYLL